MATVQYTFERFEKKFVLTPEQYERLNLLLPEYMEADQFGLHTVCNVYYDTDQYDLIRRSIDRPVYKEKFRLRSYGVPGEEDYIFAEIKKKYKGVVYKTRLEAAWDDIQRMLAEGELLPCAPRETQEEMHWFVRRYHPVPKVYLAYERVALVEKENEEAGLRVTFDQNIRWREDELYLHAGDRGVPVLPEERIIMEIKTAQAIPLWMVNLLSECRIYPGSFSKYGTCYQSYIAPAKFAG